MAPQIIDRQIPDGSDNDRRIDAFEGYDHATGLRWRRSVDEVVRQIDDGISYYSESPQKHRVPCKTASCPGSLQRYVTTFRNGLLADNLGELPSGTNAMGLQDVFRKPRYGLFGGNAFPPLLDGGYDPAEPRERSQKPRGLLGRADLWGGLK
jgi:hypothetical protein